ncbi:unnamed protein product [Paramecium pentaurelia]|uniref:Tyrosine-protein phosphatase domain-containing protein n=1 Tax=Paramecium pentaurelia TaxID=43138 RepID=A0A8S1TTN3_9CILI|nr:unnamed protein product [Paramecium pentaurelia]
MSAQPQQQIIFGACKVKDGLYIGDEYAAKDIEFIVANKIGYIVNCSSDSIENLLENIGIMYFSFQWPEDQPEIVVSKDFVNNVHEFIEESVTLGQSCLITSLHGQSRACSLVTIYLMNKFKWSLYKTLEYLNSRRSDLEIKTSFFTVLNQIEKLLNPETLSKKWEIQPNTNPDEVIITNTFFNAQSQQIDQIYIQPTEFQKMNNKSYISLIGWTEQHVQQKHNPLNQFKSILKGSNAVFTKDGGNRKLALKSFSVNKENIPESVPQRKNTPSQRSTQRSTSNPKQLQQPLIASPFINQSQLPPPNLQNQISNQSQKIPPKTIQPLPPSGQNSKKSLIIQKENSLHKKNSGNQVVYPVKILRPKMPNFDNI